MAGAHTFSIRFLKMPIYLLDKPEGASLSADDLLMNFLGSWLLGPQC